MPKCEKFGGRSRYPSDPRYLGPNQFSHQRRAELFNPAHIESICRDASDDYLLALAKNRRSRFTHHSRRRTTHIEEAWQNGNCPRGGVSEATPVFLIEQ